MNTSQNSQISRKELLEKWKEAKRNPSNTGSISNKTMKENIPYPPPPPLSNITNMPSLVKDKDNTVPLLSTKKDQVPMKQDNRQENPNDMLKDKLRQAQKLLKQKQNELAEKQDLINLLQGEIKSLSDANTTLQAKMQSMQEQLKEDDLLISELNEAQKDIMERLENYELMQQSNESLQQELIQLECQLEADRRARDQMEVKLEAMQNALKETVEENKDLYGQLENVKQDHDTKLKSDTNAISVQTDPVQTTDKAIDTQCNYSTLIREAEFIAREFKMVKFAANTMHMQLQELKRKSEQECQVLQEELERKEIIIEELEDQLQSLNDQIDALNREKEELATTDQQALSECMKQYEQFAMDSIREEITRREEVEDLLAKERSKTEALKAQLESLMEAKSE